MARKPRIHCPGAFYHVIIRGNARQDIFFDPRDRYRFHLLLQEGTERFGHRLHAFCLMDNHVHLVVQVGEVPLSRIMQNLCFRYTRWVNWRHQRSGHLFQGRYKAVLVDGDAYLLELVRYVHLNPVRAKVVELPESYPWTSHGAYGGTQTLPWLTTQTVLSMFSRRRAQAIRAYQAFVADGIAGGRREAFHGEGIEDSRILGDERFVAGVVGETDVPVRVSVAEVVSAVCERYGMEVGALALPGKNQTLSRARGMAAWIIQGLPSTTLTELARTTGRDLSSLSALARRLELRSRSQKELRKEREEILAKIATCQA